MTEERTWAGRRFEASSPGRRPTCIALALLVLLLAGCGGGGSSKLSDEDLNKLTSADSAITGYCIQGIQNQIGQGSGGSLGQLNQAVSTLIDEYKAHPDAKFKLTPIVGAPEQSMRSFLRKDETALGANGCAPDAANRLEHAIAGD